MGNNTRMDHLATWHELCEAFAFSALEDFQQCPSFDGGHDAETDFNSCVGLLAEELAWFAFASGVQDGTLN